MATTKKVRMLVAISGTRAGDRWPGRGEVADIPTDEAEQLIANRYAEAVEEAKAEEPPKPKRPARKPAKAEQE